MFIHSSAVLSTRALRQSWDDSGRAAQLESSPSCLSSPSEQNKHFKQGLLCLFPGYSLMGKQFTHFLSPNIQITEQGCWFQRLEVVCVLLAEVYMEPMTNPCPWLRELLRALSCPSWATQQALKDESESKIKCTCLCGHEHVRGGFSH